MSPVILACTGNKAARHSPAARSIHHRRGGVRLEGWRHRGLRLFSDPTNGAGWRPQTGRFGWARVSTAADSGGFGRHGRRRRVATRGVRAATAAEARPPHRQDRLARRGRHPDGAGIVTCFLKDRNYTLAGRKVDLIVGDTGGNPAGTKAKAQELVERDHVDAITGPLAAFELLAITDYIAQNKVPTLSLAAAEDMTQRKPNPYFIRASATSAQAMQPMADYAAKELKYKRVVTIVEDFAFGYEQMGGFQRVFEDNGGHVLKKLWPPLVTADYTPYLAQIGDVDAVVQGFAGSNPVKFMKQYADQGLKFPVIGGETAADDALLHSFGDEAIGLIAAAPYGVGVETEENKRFLAAMKKEYNAAGGQYSGAAVAQRPGDRGRAGQDRRQGRRQGCAGRGDARRRDHRQRRAGRSASTISAMSSATFLSAASRKRTARWSRPCSRPIPT